METLLILKNRIVDRPQNINSLMVFEYLIINTEDNTYHKKQMTKDQANSFSEKLEAKRIAPIDLLGTDYTEVSKEEFEYPLPF